MNFKESKAIYLQIADRICDEILLGQFGEEERIPSVREYAAIVEVNANTGDAFIRLSPVTEYYLLINAALVILSLPVQGN